MAASTINSGVRVSRLEEKWEIVQKSFEAFHAQFSDIPHSFQLKTQEEPSASGLRYLQSTLESALAVGYHTALETARARNLVAYLHFQFQNLLEALRETEAVLKLEGQEQNLVSLANRAVILWHLGRRDCAEQDVQRLRRMRGEEERQFPYLVLKAKAELAFSYTRCLPDSYPLAEALFREVIPQAVEPEVWVWKFGLAFTRRRMLRPQFTAGPKVGEDYLDVVQSFVDIIQGCDDNRLKAKTYAELALLLDMARCADLQTLLQERAGLGVLQACQLAVDLDDRDHSVLWKCGKLHRYHRNCEQSRQLLEKAVSIRPSSKAYHNLGLTYKAMATNEKGLKSHRQEQQNGVQTIPSSQTPSRNGTPSNSNMDTPAENDTPASNNAGVRAGEDCGVIRDRVSDHYFLHFQRQTSRSRDMEALHGGGDQDTTDSPSQPPASGANLPSLVRRPDDGDNHPPTPASGSSGESTEPSTREDFQNWKVVKCPARPPVRLCMEDLYVAETIRSLDQAVRVSQTNNRTAVYDLALVYRSIGESIKAKELLEMLVSKAESTSMVDQIKHSEQLGLVLADMAEESDCEVTRNQLLESSQSMFRMAVICAAKIYRKNPAISKAIGRIWNSFPALLEAVDKKEQGSAEKLQEKAQLFRLVQKHKKSLAILQSIKERYPQKCCNPEYLKLSIENYVEMQEYEQAVVLVELLQCVSQSNEIVQLFEDKWFLQKIYLRAAKQALQRGFLTCRKYFRTVFSDVIQHEDICTSSEDTDTEDDQVAKPTWDVHIVHEDAEKDRDVAAELASVLTELCGLRVTRMDEDVKPGFFLDGMVKVMRRSKVVVVVVTATQKPSRDLGFLVRVSARRSTSVSLLVGDARVPSLMKLHRSVALSPERLHLAAVQATEKQTAETVAAVCKLFEVLVGVELDEQ